MPATLGLFCYVRNEEALLGKALESVRPVVDELVVIDTGSTDNTPAIAREYADQVVKWVWGDDFAAASNFGASLIESDYAGKWDGDWVLSPDSQAAIGSLKTDDFRKKDLWEGRWISEFESDLTPRIVNRKTFFYRRGNFEWRGLAHDYLVPLDGTKAREAPWYRSHHLHPQNPPSWIGYAAEITVYHYKDPHANDRHDQTLRLIDTELGLVANPEERERLLYFGVNRAVFAGDFARAWDYLALLPQNPPAWAQERTASLLFAEQDFETLSTYLDSLKITTPQLDLIRADYWAVHDPERAVSHYRRFLQDYPYTRRDLNVDFQRYLDHPHRMLGLLTNSQ